MKREVVSAPTPRHACARAATSCCETFISLTTATAAGPAATVAHGLVGLVLANQTSAATAATLDQHLRSAAVTASPTTARYSQKPARRDRFSVEIWDGTASGVT